MRAAIPASLLRCQRSYLPRIPHLLHSSGPLASRNCLEQDTLLDVGVERCRCEWVVDEWGTHLCVSEYHLLSCFVRSLPPWSPVSREILGNIRLIAYLRLRPDNPLYRHNRTCFESGKTSLKTPNFVSPIWWPILVRGWGFEQIDIVE